MNGMGDKALVLLDRDGTINEDVGYLSDPEAVVLINGAAAAIKKLNTLGIKVVVVTNQSGVGRGFYTEDDMHAVNKRVMDLLGAEGAAIDGVYYCPHHPDVDCDCRKPKAGMYLKAIREHGMNAEFVYVVGDKSSDMGLAREIEGKAILVLTGEGRRELEKMDAAPDFVADDLRGAIDWIISDLDGRKQGE